MITLTTPVETGDLDPDGPYTKANITNFRLAPTDKRVYLTVQSGAEVDGAFKPGSLSKPITVVASDEGFDALYAKLKGEGLKLSDLLRYVIEHSEEISGTV